MRVVVWSLLRRAHELPGGARFSRLLFALFVLRQVSALLDASHWRGIAKSEGVEHLVGERFNDALDAQLSEVEAGLDLILVVLERLLEDDGL